MAISSVSGQSSVLVVILSSIVTVSAVSWASLFPGLQPYKDPNEEEAGEPRVGFIQLNSGSTSFNTTLNLTGPILLGLGIAAATLFYAYFNAFNGRKKRSVGDLSSIGTRIDGSEDHLLTVLDAIELTETLDEFLSSVGVRSRDCQLRTVCEMYQGGGRRGQDRKVDSVSEMVRMAVDTLHTGATDPEVEEVTREWTEAASRGYTGAHCPVYYSACEKLNFESDLLRLSH